MTSEERYRRALYLIDASCLTLDMDDTPTGRAIGAIYTLAHVASRLCNSPSCQNYDEVADRCEKALVELKVCDPWEDIKKEKATKLPVEMTVST